MSFLLFLCKRNARFLILVILIRYCKIFIFVARNRWNMQSKNAL